MRSKHIVLSVALVPVAVVALAACGSSSGSGAPTSSSAAPSSRAGANGPAGGVRPPGTSGEIAAVDGSTMQVQGQDGQVAVSWTGDTTFTQQVSVEAASIEAGDCVVARSDSGAADATTVTATTISVTEAVNGECTAGFGGGGFPGGGIRPSGVPTRLPSGFPTEGAMPAGVPSGGRGFSGSLVTGKVESVTGSSIVVAALDLGSGQSGATTTRTVTVSADTTITGQREATEAAVEVGKCANAQGESDDSGALTATSISITAPVDGKCGFRGGFGGPGA